MGHATASYHAGLTAQERRAIESDWLRGKIPFVICTSAFGMGINKPDVRWVVHFHAPLLLSEYVQEIGRAGRDGKPARALTLISEPTGWLDPEDKQRQKFFAQQARSLQLQALQLVKKLPKTGEVDAIARQFPNGAIALSLLHSCGQLHWLDPFHYIIAARGENRSIIEIQTAKQINRYLTTKQCRWQFLLQAFGFATSDRNWHCGHCDNCQQKANGR